MSDVGWFGRQQLAIFTIQHCKFATERMEWNCWDLQKETVIVSDGFLAHVLLYLLEDDDAMERSSFISLFIFDF